MKKVFFSVVFMVATLISASAQFYAGGAFSYESNSDKSGADLRYVFMISPEIGYYINPKLDVGLDLDYMSGEMRGDQKFTVWAIEPYARYSVFQYGKFEVIGKGSVGFGGAEAKDNWNEAKSTVFGLNIVPLLAYNLTENVVLFTQLNCLALNFISTSPDEGDSYWHFGFGAGTDNLLNTSNLQIGFVYKF